MSLLDVILGHTPSYRDHMEFVVLCRQLLLRG